MRRNVSLFVELIEAICDRMEEERIVFPTSCIVPSVFYVTLVPELLDVVQPVKRHFEKELFKALEERLNKISQKKPHNRNGPWQLQLFPGDPNRQPKAIDIACQIPREVSSTPIVDGGPDPRTVPVRRTQRRPRLEYRDKNGARSFLFPQGRSEISIGRDPNADLTLDAPTDVSRIHCMIRRDVDQRFWIRDLSKLGTTVNGARLIPYVAPTAGQKGLSPNEVQLQEGARIVLAQDIVQLEFRTE